MRTSWSRAQNTYVHRKRMMVINSNSLCSLCSRCAADAMIHWLSNSRRCEHRNYERLLLLWSRHEWECSASTCLECCWRIDQVWRAKVDFISRTDAVFRTGTWTFHEFSAITRGFGGLSPHRFLVVSTPTEERTENVFRSRLNVVARASKEIDPMPKSKVRVPRWRRSREQTISF